MFCEGTEDNECPYKRSGSDVEFSQGDLWLCPDCFNARFKKPSNAQKPSTISDPVDPADLDIHNTSQTELKRVTRMSTNTEGVMNSALPQSAVNDNKMLIDPLMSYTLYSLQNSTPENVKHAILCHFTADQINKAKSKLWETSDINIIGEKVRRKDSTVRTEKEANIQDILTAISKLDRVNKMPNIMMSAMDIGTIPKSFPEELMNISLADRLNQLEAKFTHMQEIVDRNVCETLQIKDKMSNSTSASYANAVKNTLLKNSNTVKDFATKQQEQLPCNQTDKKEIADIRVPHLDIPIITTSDNAKHDTDNNIALSAPPARFNYNPRGRGAYQSSRGNISRGAKPGLRNNGRSSVPPGTVITLGQGSSMQSISGKSFASDVSNFQNNRETFDNDFLVPSHVHRRNNRAEKRRRNVITGNSKPQGSLKGAPEPGRDLFVFRVDNANTTSDLRNHITDYGFNVRGLSCVSHENSKFKSFKLTVPMSEYNELFNENMWPCGIKIRKYVPPRREVSS